MPSQTTKPIVLVTGASGLIGSPTADRLAKAYTVVGLDRPGAPHPPPSADNIPLDLTSAQECPERTANRRREIRGTGGVSHSPSRLF